ncbi:porin [Methylomonas sp. SURF-1]|uniref:Porin n=1 Tax=Methylomonas aurea TaxID=2952224 RepID=A0ABT1UDT3_9GAMM|nr:porin [Methylomonas sp. SURF-1]MCQ8180399.1 porin [Methylomonas sp. SURF-1]
MKKVLPSLTLGTRGSLAAVIALCCGSAVAETWSQASGLLSAAGIDPNESKFMKDHNLKLGGWFNASIGANMSSNGDGFNGPVTFNDRSGEFQVNQFYLYFQKSVNVSGDAFDIGGRVDAMYGTDAIFTQAYGSPGFDPKTLESSERGSWDLGLSGNGERFYGLALPQAYAEINLPFGNGIDVKLGHFYTPIGYEVVTAPDNFFITKPYTMQYGEPFTHTGVLATYAANANWTVMGGAVTGSSTGGWDGNWDRDLGNWAWLGGVTWTSDDAGTSLAVTSTAGKRAEHVNDSWSMYSVVGKHNFTDKLHYIIQHDHGFAQNIWLPADASGNGDAEWYGINQYLIYDVNDKVSAGLRAEWFRDHNGIRVYGPGRCYAASANQGDNFACGGNYLASYTQEGSSYYAVTAGMSYKPAKWLNLRPNLRYDFTDDARAFDNGTRQSQFLFTADVVVTF